MGSKKIHQHAYGLPARVIQERVGLYSSGAAGVHQDQLAKKDGASMSRRQSTRAERVRAAVLEQREPGS